VDPAAGWFPHYLGFAGETGAADSNLNVPVAPGTGDDGWLEAIASAIEWVRRAGARSLVVSLGVDAGASDPEAPLRVTGNGFHEAGRALSALELPTVVVQEGGYDLDTVGQFVQRTLSGLDR
jgi:acetoin utilization deacetylase AcuC-like enzyme